MPEIPLGLKTALESGQCVLFVGAGIGACVKDLHGNPAPNGQELAQAIAGHFGLEDTEGSTLAQVAQLVEIRKGRRELETYIADRLRSLEPNDELLWLFSLRWKAIFTTNYDAVIQEAYGRLESPRQTPVTISVTSELVSPDPDLEVPVYHLHGSLFHGERAPIVITEDDYARFRERRRMLFALLKFNCATSTILYVGYSNQDPNWQGVLAEMKAEFFPSEPPVAYRVTPGTRAIEVEILKARGVETIGATLQEFVASAKSVLDATRLDAANLQALRERVPGDLSSKFDEAPASMMRLLDAWTYVNQAPFDAPPNMLSFLKGEIPNWALVGKRGHFERDVEGPVYDAILDLVTGNPRVASILLLAPAGYGVSTTLMALAARLVADHAGPVFMHRRGAPLREGDLLFASSLSNEPTLFFVDNASDDKSQLSNAIHRLKDAKRPAILVMGERLNEWIQRYPQINGQEFRIDPLSDLEIPRLLQVLEEHGALGSLEHLKPELRIAAVREKHGKQLLVVLREVTEGRSFDAIIEDEFRGIDEAVGQELYAAVCCAYQIRAYIRDAVLGEVLGLDLPRLYEKTRDATEGIVEFDYEDSRRGYYAARARHHVIAQVVWARCIPQAEKSTLIERILGALNLAYHTDARLLDGFIRTDLIVDSIPGLEGKIRFFEAAAKKRPDDPYVLQHYARMLLRSGKPDLALSQIQSAISMDDRARVLHHTKGMILAQLAATIESPEIARRRLAQAEEAYRRSMSMNERDPYPYQSLAELYFTWAKRCRDDAERIDYLTRAEEVIGDGMRKVWDREGLWIVSASIQHWLGNTPEATRALERGVAEAPGSIVARYILGVRYLDQGDPQRAMTVLQPLVTENPNEFRPCIVYARAQVEAGERYDAAIATMRLGELFGSRDARFIAILGAMQYMNGDFTGASGTFGRTSGLELSFEEQTAIHFTAPEYPGSHLRLRLQGEVVAVKKGFAFVRTPGYEDVFCPRSKIGELILKVGMKVSYEIAFSARGPIAMSLRSGEASEPLPQADLQ